jgi:ABC-type branched-subunit amino acid transport system substrate-binding protein
MIGGKRSRRLALLIGLPCVAAAVVAALELPPIDTIRHANGPRRDGDIGSTGNGASARLPGTDRDAGPISAGSEDVLSPEERRGKTIYLTGTSPSGGEITASLGKVEAPPATLRCVYCHGADGQGRPEGGIFPSALTWDALTKTYGSRFAGGRSRPAYTARLLGRAITMGIDSAGNALNPAMPRYRLSHQDLADLLAYLKRIGNDADPGVTADTIRIGVLLPPPSDFPDLHRALRSALTAFFDDINSSGGAYQRKLDVRFADAPQAPDERTNALRAFVEREGIFALAAAFMEGAENEMTGYVSKAGLPLIGAFTHDPQLSFPLKREVFHLHAGLSAQAETLAAFAAKALPLGDRRCAIIFADEGRLRDAAIAVERRLEQQGCRNIEQHQFKRGQMEAAALARHLDENGTMAVVLLGCGIEELSLLHEAHRRGWRPSVFIPGAVAEPGIAGAPSSFNGHILLAFSGAERTEEQTRAYRELAGAYCLPSNDVPAQLAALTSARILVEGLRRSGAGVTREKLIDAIEGLDEFETGTSPPITYGPNRRVGTWAMTIVSVDLYARRLVPVRVTTAPCDAPADER